MPPITPTPTTPQPSGRAVLPIFNATTDTIPPGAALQIIGWNGSQFIVQQPSTDDMDNVVFNSGSAVLPGFTGSAINYFPCAAAYSRDNYDGADPQYGDNWGTRAGEWFLFRDQYGFCPIELGRAGVVMVTKATTTSMLNSSASQQTFSVVDWSTTQDGTLNTVTQTGAGDKTTQDGSWSVLDSVTGGTVSINTSTQSVGTPLGTAVGTTPALTVNDSGLNAYTNIASSHVESNGTSINTLMTPYGYGPTGGWIFYLWTFDTEFNGAPVLPAYAIGNVALTDEPLVGIWGTVITPVCAGGLVIADASSLNGSTTPAVSLNTNIHKIAINAPTLAITGTGISTNHSNDTITFSTLSATATVNTSPAPTVTSMTVTFGTPPSGVGWLRAKITVSGTDSQTGVVVAEVVPAPTVTLTTTAISQTAQYITITGTGFDPNASGNSVVFSGAASPCTGTVYIVNSAGTEMTVLITAPTSTGQLKAVVTSYGGGSGSAVEVASISAGTGPVVSSSTDAIPLNATTMIIYGNHFSATPASNTIALSPSGTATVTASTTTQITVTLSGIVSGPLYAVDTTSGVTSGSPVQIATVVSGPTITLAVNNLATNATTLTITGTGFIASPTANTVTLSSGTATVASATSTVLVLNLTGPLSTGVLTATVTVGGQTSSAVQVANVVQLSVTLNTANLAQTATSLVIAGSGFDAFTTGTFVVLSDGEEAYATWESLAGTSLVFTFSPSSLPLPLGSLTAIAQGFGGSSGAAVQVATVVVSTHSWLDNFTEVTNTSLAAHTPNTGSGGYTILGDPGTITGGTSGWYVSSGSSGDNKFDPGAHLATCSFKVIWQSTITGIEFNWNGRGSFVVDLGAGWQVNAVVGFTGSSNFPVKLTNGTLYTFSITDNGTNVYFYLDGVQCITPITDSTAPTDTTCQMQMSVSSVDPTALWTQMIVN
jgi:hypothetical protein